MERTTLLEREIGDLERQIRLQNEAYDAFAKAGLKRSDAARKALDKANVLRLRQRDLIAKDEENLKVVAANMLLCIAAADFACECANIFEHRLIEVYGSKNKAEDALIDLLRKNATALAEIVVLIDGAKSKKLSLNFAEMSEEIMDTLTESNLYKAAEIVCKHMESKDGRAFLLTDKDFKHKKEQDKCKQQTQS